MYTFSNFEHKLKTIELVRDFIFAGKSTFTLRNANSGNRFTYEVRAPRKQNTNKPVFFVKVMTGSDNEKSYSFAGTLFGKYKYQHSPKSPLTITTNSLQFFQAFLRFVETGVLPNGVEFWHEGRCGHCGKKLTVPESIRTGFGPLCAPKMWKESKRQLKLTTSK